MVSPLPFQKATFIFLDFLIKIILSALKNLFFTTKDAQSILKIRFLVTFLHS